MTVTLDRARVKNEDGSYTSIGLPGSQYGNGLAATYRETDHKGKLICACCPAELHYVSQSSGLVGTSHYRPRPEHFALNPGQEHTCSKPNPAKDNERHFYNVNDGLRVHLNIPNPSGEFNDKTLYYRDGKKWRVRGDMLPSNINKDEFQEMETASVSSVSDLLDLMERGDLERLSKSYLVAGHRVIPFRDFVLRQDSAHEGIGSKRFQRFLQQLKRDAEGYKGLPRAVELNTEKTNIPFSEKLHTVDCKAIFLDRLDDGPRFIIPHIDLDMRQNKFLRDKFEEAGKFTIMGMVRSSMMRNGNIGMYVKVSDERQIDRRTPGDILKTRSELPFPEAA